MRVIVCGAGKVGTSIAEQLVNQNNDVTVIDQSQDLISKISLNEFENSPGLSLSQAQRAC